MTIRAKFDGRVFVPVDPVDLPAGWDVEVDLKDGSWKRPLSGPQILEALDRYPDVPAEDAAEMERLIEEGMKPVEFGGIFDPTIDAPADDSKG